MSTVLDARETGGMGGYWMDTLFAVVGRPWVLVPLLLYCAYVAVVTTLFMETTYVWWCGGGGVRKAMGVCVGSCCLRGGGHSAVHGDNVCVVCVWGGGSGR